MYVRYADTDLEELLIRSSDSSIVNRMRCKIWDLEVEEKFNYWEPFFVLNMVRFLKVVPFKVLSSACLKAG